MALRAKKPEQITKRLKLFLFGAAGTGKTTSAIQFPQAYIIDAEKGSENYDDLINSAGSVVFHTTDIDEVLEECRSLRSDPHDYRTLVIDPSTPLFEDALEKGEKKVGTEFGRHYGEAGKSMKRLCSLIMALDMNVIVTSHAKVEYGDDMKKTGYTFDSWKKLDYLFDLVLQLERRGEDRYAIVRKTRLKAFPDGDAFRWSYAEFVKRHGDAIANKAEVAPLATTEDVTRLNKLLEAVKLPDGTTDKWLKKANVECFEDMSSAAVAKCIEFIEKKIKEAA